MTIVRIKDEGCLVINTVRHKYHAIICSIFDEDNRIMPSYTSLNHHIDNLNAFIALKCDYDNNFDVQLMEKHCDEIFENPG